MLDRILSSLFKYCEKIFVLAVDRWHPIAKLTEATGRQDLLESAIAINGAPSTAEFVIRYGPINFDQKKREFRSCNRPDLAPLEIIQPLLSMPISEQEQATRYILENSRNPTTRFYDFKNQNLKSLDSIAKNWQEFERNMSICFTNLSVPYTMVLEPDEMTPQGLLTMVSQNIFFALRSDFMSRLFETIITNEQAMSSIARRPESKNNPGNLFYAMIKGRIHELEFIDDNFIAMLTSLHPNPIKSSGENLILRFAITVKTVLTVGITATPEFAIKNGIRDMLSAFVLGKEPQYPLNTITGGIQVIKQSETLKDWMLQGGGFGSFYDHALDTNQTENKRFILSLSVGKSQVKRRLMQVWNIYTVPFRALESGSRITQYERILAAGGTRRQAMIQSRQISTDFSDRGASETWWNYCRTVPFLNAALQGMNLFRKVYFTSSGTGGRTHGIIATTKASAHARKSLLCGCFLTLIPLGALLWNISDSSRKYQYEAQAAFDKASYVYFYEVSGIDFRIPVPFELGGIFMKIPELVADRALNLSTVDSNRLHLNAIDRIPPTIISLVESTFLLSFIPAIIQPAYHVIRNRDFLNREIEPNYMQKWPVAARKYSSTPTAVQKLSEIVPIFSPLKLKVLLEGHFGHMARLFFHGTDEIFWDTQEFGEKAFPQFWYRASGLRAFVRSGPVTYTRHSIDFYRLKDYAEGINAACRLGVASCSDARNRKYFQVHKLFNKINKRLRNTRKAIRLTYKDNSLSRKSKEFKIHGLYSDMNRVFSRILHRLRMN